MRMRNDRRVLHVRDGLVVCLLGAAAALAQAQERKPGLWQVEQKLELPADQQKQMDEARRQLAAMPAAQRKQMEAMLAQKGLQIDLAAGGQKAQICLSQNDIARDEAPVDRRDDCKYDTRRAGATMTVNYQCSQPVSKGEIVVTSVSPERYTMKMVGTDAKGARMAMTGEGRWLQADCGKLAPIGAAGKR